MILRISYLKNQKDTAEMFPPASEDPIPDKYLTSSSFKIHSFPVPLFKQFYSCNFPISQKMLRAFFWPSNLFSDIKARERIFGPKFSFFVFPQKIIMTAWRIFKLHLFDFCWWKRLFNYFPRRAKWYSSQVQHLWCFALFGTICTI